MLLPLRFLPFAAGVLLLFTCGQSSEDQAVIHYEKGIPDGPEITYEQVLDITPSDHVMFNRISDLLVTSEGDLLIFDAGSSIAYLLDADGNYLSSGIGEGQGPGEVRFPSSFLHINNNDEFVVYCYGLRRFSVYKIKDQKINHIFDTHTLDMLNPIVFLPITVLANGSIMFFEFGFNNPTGEIQEVAKQINREGEIVRDSYISIPAREMFSAGSRQSPILMSSPHGRINRGVVHGDMMVIINQVDLGFQRYSVETGELLTEVIKDVPDLPVTRDENREIINFLSGSSEIDQSQMSDLLDQMPVVRGNVSHVRYDPAGYVWLLLLPDEEENSPFEWVVFTEEGEFTGRITLSDRAIILRVHNGFLYILTEDDNGLPLVRVLKTDLL